MNAKRQGRTIASNIVRMTLMVGVFVVLSAAIVGVVGASRLARSEILASQRGQQQRVEERIETALNNDAEILDAAASAISVSSTDAPGVVHSAFDKSESTFERVVVVSPNGKVVASYPPTSAAISSGRILGGATAPRVTGTFVVKDPQTSQKSVWIARSATMPQHGNVVVLGRIDMSFIERILAMEAPAHGTVAVLAPKGVIEAQTGVPLSEQSIAAAARVADGTVRPFAADGTPMSGVIDGIEGLPGLEWSVLIAQPVTDIRVATFGAVAPSIGVMLLGGLIAVGLAWGVSTRLSDPLRDLEEAAYHAAEGSYVKPLDADRDDEIGRLAEAFNAVAMRLNALHDLSQLLASSTSLDQVLDGILSAMGHIIGPGITAIYLLDDSRQLLCPVRARGAQIDILPALPAMGETWIVEALMAIEPRVVTGPEGRIRELLPGLAPPDSLEAIAIPLVSGYEALGVIVYVSDEDRGFNEGEIEMLRTFAAQAAVAVNNSRMFAEEGESRQVAQVLQAVAEDLVAPGDLEAAIGSVLNRLRTLFDAKAVHIAYSDRSALGLFASHDPVREHAMIDMGLRALEFGDALGPVALPRGADPHADVLLDEHDSHELLVVPIAMASGHGAVLVIVTGSSGVRARDVGLADAVADEIALSLENAYLYGRAVTRASNLETIFRISQALSSSLQFNIVLNRVLDVVQKIFSADAVWLMTYDRRRRALHTEMARGTVSSEVLDIALRPGEDVQGFVYESGQPAVVRDIKSDVSGVQAMARSLGLQSMLSVPLLARGRSIGVLSILSAQRDAFSDEDLSVLQTFAAQAALSIDTARLYSREHEVATILQRSITPEELPDLPELEAAAAYVPLGPDTEIGGDYYDMMRAPDGTIVFAIGDVVGKGVIAATKTSMIKYAIRALVAAGLGPDGILREVNRMVCEAGQPGDIVTIWLGAFDPETLELRYANGGHPPALVRRTSGEVEALTATGPLLGVAPDVDYDGATATIAPGETVLLYTDGVTESRKAGEFFGEQRVRDAVQKGDPVEDLVQGLLTSVRLFAEGDLRDDVAILGVTPTGRSAESESTE